MGILLSNKKHKGIEVGISTDIVQEADKKGLKIPEIRVWCHPHVIGKKGSDYYKTFETFLTAEKFIKTHKEAEKEPLIGFRGYEIDIYTLKDRNFKKKK